MYLNNIKALVSLAEFRYNESAHIVCTHNKEGLTV
jgi:hypothetical protein